MKKLLLFIPLFLCLVSLEAQSDSTGKANTLRKLKEKQDSISNEMRSLEAEVAAQQPDSHITYSSDWPMQTVTAAVIDKRTNKPAPGIRCYLTIPGDGFELRTAVSDGEGRAKFLLQHVYATRPMIFETDQRTDSVYRIEVGDPFHEKRFSRENDNDTLAFFGSPDKRYMLDDYTRFPTMEEVLIEYVPEVKIKKTRGRYFMSVLNIPYKTFFEQGPMVLLDGVPVFNLDAFMTIDPLRIKKLEVMARRYYYGSAAWDGVVSFSTYDGDLAGYPLYENAVVKDYHK